MHCQPLLVVRVACYYKVLGRKEKILVQTQTILLPYKEIITWLTCDDAKARKMHLLTRERIPSPSPSVTVLIPVHSALEERLVDAQKFLSQATLTSLDLHF